MSWSALIARTCGRALGAGIGDQPSPRIRLALPVLLCPWASSFLCWVTILLQDNARFLSGVWVSLKAPFLGFSETPFSMVQAAEHWELALAINPLHAYAWFSLGFCALKTGKRERAVQAFTRCVQQEPDHGDAWNNLAALHLQVTHPP